MKKRVRKALILRKILFEKTGSENLKQNFLRAAPFWIGSFITGLIAVVYTRLFAWAEQGTSNIFHHSIYLFFIVTPCCFVVSWWLVRQFSPYARGSGIPQVMAAIELTTPTIQIAGSVFWKINQWLPVWWTKISRKNMIMTGAAAGLAAAFNTPLGGIVFAVEESVGVWVTGSMFGSGKELITRVLFTHEKYSSWYIALFRTMGPVLSFTTGASRNGRQPVCLAHR